MFGGKYYLSAALPEQDFRKIVTSLDLRHRPNLPNELPSFLRGENIPGWDVSATNDEFTFYGEAGADRRVARYERGRLYFILSVN